MFKLGSLFDGSGGFPLAGAMHGIVPVWASEIEPFPIRVTKLRFPGMKHLGSVTDVNGAKVEPVDIITFGSPCQDLSVAGKQLGIHEGQRSNLFFEAIRIIKEMRNATSDKFPRFAVWENVPGAFSSNKGEDFRAVLRAFAEIGEKGSEVSVPMPPKGKWLPAGTVVGNGWSLAWRVYDAQFWGVPQRRKRIYLIADFGSERAGEILFKPEGVSGHPEPGGEKREGTSGDAEGSAGRGDQPICLNFQGNKSGCCTTDDGTSYSLNAMHGHDVHVVVDSVNCLNPWNFQSYRQYDASGSYATLQARENSGLNHQGVCFALDSTASNSMKSSNPNSGFHEETVTKTLDTNPDPTCNQGGNVIVEPAAFMGGQGAKARSIAYCDDGSTPTIKSAPSGGNTVPDMVYPINTMVGTRGGKDDMRTCFGVGEPNDPQFTLSAAHEHGVCYCMEGNTVDRDAKQNGSGVSEDVSPTLMAEAGTGGNQLPPLCLNDQGGRMMDVSDIAGCLRAQEHGHQPVVCFEPGIAKRDGSEGRFVDGKSVTLRANAGDNQPAVCFQASGDRADPSVSVSEKAYCLPANPMSDRGQAVVFPCESIGHDIRSTNFGKDGKVDPLTATDWKEPPFVCYGVDCRNGVLNEEKTGTLQAKNTGGYSLNFTPSVVYDARGNGTGDICPTVCSHPKGGVHDYEPICCQANGWQYGNVVSTVVGDHNNRVCDYTSVIVERADEKQSVYSVENHPADSRVDISKEDVCKTLTSRMGTGGGIVPMILEVRDE